MSTIRIEADGASDLSEVYAWLTHHRGQIVELDGDRRLALGVPISGARAVIVAVALQDGTRTGPQLGGVLRALANHTPRAPVRFVFDVRSTGGHDARGVEEIGGQVVRAISAHIANGELVPKVA
jgi:hypothetical protein